MAEFEKVFGYHASNHVLDTAPERVLRAWTLAQRRDQRLVGLLEKLSTVGCHVEQMQRNQLDTLAEGGRHQGIVLEVKAQSALSENALFDMLQAHGDNPFLLILDGVQDPRNLGACLRVADGAGITAVIAPRDRAAGLTVSARKVASGAAVPFVQVTNLARTLRSLKEQGVWLVGTSDQAEGSVYQASLTGPLGLVLGGEEKGMRRLTTETCDSLVSIPMLGAVSSLNVSVAAGVVLYEAMRQRQLK